MIISRNPEMESKLRAQVQAEEELEAAALEGLRSGEPIKPGPHYWVGKHRQLDERPSPGRGARF